jgi:HEAT repeat protein
VGGLAARAPHPIDPDLLQATRGFFTDDDPQLVRAAAISAGRLEDYDAVEGLIALLTHAEPPVREAASWALARLAGTVLPPQPERWRAWYDDERGGFEREVPRLVDDLDDVRPARVVRALVELSQRRYRRDRLAASIAPLLEHARPELRRLTCSALGRLGSPAGVAALIAHLDDVDPDVAREAWLALETITGAGLPPEATAWRETYTGG